MRRVVFLLLVGLVASGCGSTRTVTVTQTVTVTAPSREAAARVYFLRDGRVAPVARALASTAPAALLATQRAGPTAAERAAEITMPSGDAETAAIVYTLSQFAPADPVRYAGKTYARADFEDLTPAILVESPLPFQAVASPLRVTGTANTFEATFDYELRDPAGKVLAHGFATATSGSGQRGTFDFTIPFEAPNGVGKLVVFERSAADGSRIHQVEIPLTLAR